MWRGHSCARRVESKEYAGKSARATRAYSELIFDRNSPFDFVLFSLSMSSSMASTGRQRVQNFSQHPDSGQIFFRNQQLFFSSAGALNINRRERSLVDELAVEDDFHVAGAFEFFKDHVVHAGPGVNQGSSNNS